MKQHAYIQGTPEWLAHRATHFNASDAPAMLGCSKYKTRTQLLHELHTGITPDANEHQQRRFADGHRFEALARPLAEKIIGDDLYPVVGSVGRLSASYDGLTMDQATAFEHKMLNDQLRAALFSDEGASALPKAYRVQMEQQCMVSGAERVLFMASVWQGDVLQEEMHAWYEPDPALREEILAGWEQFEVDLAAYVPKPVVPAVTAAAMESLPAVSVRLAGQLQVVSNLPEFGTALRGFISRMVPKPSTDQEFANAEAECKALKKAEEAIDAADEYSLASLTDVAAARTMMADLRALARTTRLAREKLVTAEKESRRTKIVTDASAALRDHVSALDERLGGQYMPPWVADFAGAIRGKKNLDSMQDAVDGLLVQSKAAAGATADRVQANLKHLDTAAADYKTLFPDLATLVLKQADDFAALVRIRVSDQQAKDQQRVDELAEEARERIREEERTKAEAAAAAPAPAPAPESTSQSADAPAPAASSTVVRMVARAQPAPAPAAPVGPPTLRLGQIADRLGYSLTAEFLRGLGIEAAGRERAAVLYHEADYLRLLDGMDEHHARLRAAYTQPAAA